MTRNARRIDFYLDKEDHAELLAKHSNEDPKAVAKRLLLDHIRCRGPADHITETKKLDSETKRLKNLKLCLDIWNGLKVAGFSLDQAAEVMRGERTIPAPELPFLKPSKSDGRLCDFCGHEHVKTEPRVCKELSCLCGVR